MADFKSKDRRCRIDPAIGAPVVCTFDADLENQVYALLRQPVRAVGSGVVKPESERPDLLHLTSLESMPSLELGEDDFFAESTIAELAQMQGIKPVENLSILSGGIPEHEDLDAFLAEIYGARR